MPFTLSIDTGKRLTRRVSRQSAMVGIAALVADNGQRRVEVEIRHDGQVIVTVADEMAGSRSILFKAPRMDGQSSMPAIAIHQSGDDHITHQGDTQPIAHHLRCKAEHVSQ